MVKDFVSAQTTYRARAPLRVSFAGGGTELQPYLSRYGGVVLNATISRYVYATITAAEKEVTFVAADCNLEETLSLTTVLHQTSILPLHQAIYRRMIETYNDGKVLPLKLHTFSDAPVGSGLGASSTLTVAIIRCFDELLGINMDEYQLAQLAHDIERVDLNLSGGYQDQYAAAFGGFNWIEFHQDGNVIVNPLSISPRVTAELEYSLMMYYTGISRSSADIIEGQKKGIEKGEIISLLHQIKETANEMKNNLLKARLREFATGLNEGWKIKRKTEDSVSTPEIDYIYEIAMKSGAWGAKVSGAGGGGFFLLMVPPEKRNDVLSVLPYAKERTSFCHFNGAGAEAWRLQH